MSTTNPNRVSSWDQIGIWIFIAVAALLVGGSAWLSGMRVADLLGPDPYDIQVGLIGSTANVSSGSDGASIPVSLETARIQVPTLPTASLVAGILEPIVTTLTVAGIAVLLTLLASSILRGRIFSKRNTLLVVTAGTIAMVGFPLAGLFQTMLANGALAVATHGALDNSPITFSPTPIILIAFAVGVFGTAFTIGERLQRETEGLV
ncbi:hypothetical protein JD292_11450 [Leucobacter sp. CSA2]|uniref:DUF2975 domain-containing protein n=1 Tax=Leucobacter edaphi TaxID=2796472 RepID=A0A934UYR6_9MICO|nr:hypothetical protein [Leucobacter edaphi]MBK0422687.1 hypothetical protein [Leucobacter edaphi]